MEVGVGQDEDVHLVVLGGVVGILPGDDLEFLANCQRAGVLDAKCVRMFQEFFAEMQIVKERGGLFFCAGEGEGGRRAEDKADEAGGVPGEGGRGG